MKDEKIKSQLQVFICNHKSCADKNSKDLTDRLKKWSKEETDKEVKIFRSGCLGKCDEGIAIACFPEKRFLLEVEEDDFKEVRDSLEKKWKDLKAQRTDTF